VYVHGSAWNHALLDAYATQVGRRPSFAGTFHEFSSTRSDDGERFPDFPNGYAPQVSELTAWAARGIVPVLTWQPLSDYANGPDAAYTLLTITAGNHDAEINAWATAAAAYGKPLYIRFAHEMNGDWYPWGQHINGNTPAQYVAAWRYVVNKFRAAGATNVKWIWAPNVLYGTTWPITGLYPGDSYVDVIGMDGYNWGTSGDGPVGWYSFTTLFAGLYDQVRALAPSKPIIVAEVNSAESGGDKAAWIKSAFLTEIPARFPAVQGVMWFDTTGGFDPNWSISTSSSALTAFRTVVADSGWQGTLP
jgi:beta-mannanase